MPKKLNAKKPSQSALSKNAKNWLREMRTWERKSRTIIALRELDRIRPPLPEAKYKAELGKMNKELDSLMRKMVSVSDPSIVKQFGELQSTNKSPFEILKRAGKLGLTPAKDSLATQFAKKAFELAIRRAAFIDTQKARIENQKRRANAANN